MMKKSISTWSFYGNLDFSGKLALAREAGFAGFEPDLSEAGAVNFSISNADLLGLRKKADQAGMVLSGLATGLYWGANPASADPSVRSKAATILARQVECAAALGIDAVLVVPGAVGVDFLPGSEIVPYDLAYRRGVDFIKAALPLAEKHCVTLCVENVWNKFLLSPLEMREFIDGFGSERVGAYFDVGNVLSTGYPEHWIRILGTRIRRIHLKDYRRAVGSVDGFCDLLSGDVDWAAVASALKSVPYSGWVTAEMIPPVPFYKHCPEVLIHNTSRAMDAILGL
jgi:hexulose-6-phosphate isomerase